MLNTLSYIAIGLGGLFILACVALVVLMAFIVLTTPKDKDGDIEAKLVRRSDIAPPYDEDLFGRLAREAMAYATRPFVTTTVEANGIYLLNTVSDAFGKRLYIESRRRIGKALHAVICVYDDGGFEPIAKAATEIPASQVDWSAHFKAIEDVTSKGPLVSFIDERGLRREVRIPKGGNRHA